MGFFSPVGPINSIDILHFLTVSPSVSQSHDSILDTVMGNANKGGTLIETAKWATNRPAYQKCKI